MKDGSLDGPITCNALIIQKSHSLIISIIPGVLYIIDEWIRLLCECEPFANLDKVLITPIHLVGKRSKMASNETEIAVMETKSYPHSSFVPL